MTVFRPIAIAIAILAGTLSACSEEPQISKRSEHQAARADQEEQSRRQRTLHQSESERIYQQGTLR